MSLSRFIAAQDESHDTALAELRAGRKRTHWMWFVFPQLAGLGRSEMAQRYAIRDLDEARAYLAHPVLGPRLVAAARAILCADTADATQILGTVDAMKLRSSATLFASVENAEPIFQKILDRFFDGIPCPLTRGLLAPTGTAPSSDPA
ncbi:hypothetical protein roselon_01156 [Roseibacterium elongatum DSM 19469]|uniref:NTP pyrophosphohydrolase n=1 Tax=Roseicyclus elongatus DSM 19469 TaxID=1294273 RepID=W8S095_9RHOB|nr:DUF1810 domain-containing protein [Roseibacterium elongatum]AHM03547.1 hypothetical protein roselon_01156 [Roseibacterium elongatum DSM 19469]